MKTHGKVLSSLAKAFNLRTAKRGKLTTWRRK
jgi:hypothetical protein